MQVSRNVSACLALANRFLLAPLLHFLGQNIVLESCLQLLAEAGADLDALDGVSSGPH